MNPQNRLQKLLYKRRVSDGFATAPQAQFYLASIPDGFEHDLSASLPGANPWLGVKLGNFCWLFCAFFSLNSFLARH